MDGIFTYMLFIVYGTSSMYGKYFPLFTHILLFFMVNVGRYTIHWLFGLGMQFLFKLTCFLLSNLMGLDYTVTP